MVAMIEGSKYTTFCRILCKSHKHAFLTATINIYTRCYMNEGWCTLLSFDVKKFFIFFLSCIAHEIPIFYTRAFLSLQGLKMGSKTDLTRLKQSFNPERTLRRVNSKIKKNQITTTRTRKFPISHLYIPRNYYICLEFEMIAFTQQRS